MAGLMSQLMSEAGALTNDAYEAVIRAAAAIASRRFRKVMEGCVEKLGSKTMNFLIGKKKWWVVIFLLLTCICLLFGSL